LCVGAPFSKNSTTVFTLRNWLRISPKISPILYSTVSGLVARSLKPRR
jgi:hypothetical protein